jgi:hypothetical protein
MVALGADRQGERASGVLAGTECIERLAEAVAWLPSELLSRGRLLEERKRPGDVRVYEVLPCMRAHVRLVKRGGVHDCVDPLKRTADELAVGN